MKGSSSGVVRDEQPDHGEDARDDQEEHERHTDQEEHEIAVHRRATRSSPCRFLAMITWSLAEASDHASLASAF